MALELYYWPHIPGRGEFVRLALEASGHPYVDVCRRPESDGGGHARMIEFLRDPTVTASAFAPPIVACDGLIVAQTANILNFLAPRLGMVPEDDASRVRANQLQLTMQDLVAEVHDVHHPIATSFYYEDQQPEAVRRAAVFLEVRLGKFLGHFERVLEANGTGYMIGSALTHPDLSLFQLMAGLQYAFPRAMARQLATFPGLVGVAERVRTQPRIADYLQSARRLDFTEEGIFRHYPELDEKD